MTHFILHHHRLMYATGMDTYNAFPYIKAALQGHGTRRKNQGNRFNRRGSACAQLFTECNFDSNNLLDYFNNHNGGLINQVQPAVDNEVGPIIQAIVADVISGDDERPVTSAVEAEESFFDSDIFQAGDNLFTGAIINAATQAFEGGLDSVVDSLVGRKRRK